MDYEFMSGMFISVLLFAPGLILLIALLFVGCLMALEKLGFKLDAIAKSKDVNVINKVDQPMSKPPRD